jgi:hypothetical protein
VLYPDISLVSVYGLRGTLHVEKVQDAEGVSVETEGPYEAKVAEDSWLRIYPEDQEPPLPPRSIRVRSQNDITAGGTHFGSVDATAAVGFLPRSGPRIRARLSRRVSRAKGTVRITAPPGTRFELIGCQGVWKGPRGSRSMMGSRQFDIR